MDPSYFGSGVIIRDYISTYGTDGLVREILEYGYSHDEMNVLEKEYVTEELMLDPKCLNLDKGGRNNFTRWPEVNMRIGEAMSKARLANPTAWPSRKGQANNKSVKWRLVDPHGQVYEFVGDLSGFCREHGISANTIKKAVSEGWIPKRGSCVGWQAFNLDTGAGTTRGTLNHGLSHSGLNNPWFKSKKDRV